MIPISLVAGFLGSGKTTLLEQFIVRLRGRRIVYLVNEFSRVDVDGRRLEALSEDVISIPGGSIFCRCLVTDFVGRLEYVRDELDTEEEPLEGVIIEASGIADPTVIRRMLRETKLDGAFELKRIITMVDPGKVGKLLVTLPNIRAQIEAADTALINKCDLHEAEVIEAAHELLLSIQPGLRVYHTTRAGVEFDPFEEAGGGGDVHGEYAPCADPNFCVVNARFSGVVRAEMLEREMKELGEALYRAKGRIQTDQGWVDVDYAMPVLSMKEAAGERSLLGQGLAVIAAMEAKDRVGAMLQRIEDDARTAGKG